MDTPQPLTNSSVGSRVAIAIIVLAAVVFGYFVGRNVTIALDDSRSEAAFTLPPSPTPAPCQNYQGDGEYWLCVGNTVTTGAFSATLAGFPTPTSAKFTLNPPIWLPGLGSPDGALRNDYTFAVWVNGYNLRLQKDSATTYAFAVKAIDFGDGAFANGRALVSVKTRVYTPGAGLPQIPCANYAGNGIYRVCAGNTVTASDGGVFTVKRIPPQTNSPIEMPVIIGTSGGDVAVKAGGSAVSGGSTLYLTRVEYLVFPNRIFVCVGPSSNPSQCGVSGPHSR